MERFDDPDGGIAGSPQKLDEATLALEHRPRPNLILKLEGRYDKADNPVFRDKNGFENSQLLLILGVVVVF